MNVEALQGIVGKDWVIIKREQMLDYVRDAVFDSVAPKVVGITR